MVSAKKLIHSGLLIGLFLFIVIYAHSRTAFLSQGAKLQVSNITNGQVVREPTLEIAGVAERANKLTINGKELPIDEFGNFANTLVFARGLNTVEIIAEDRYGKGDSLKYEILYQEDDTENLDDLLTRKQVSKPAPPPPLENTDEVEESEDETVENDEILENQETIEESLQEANTI